MKTKSLSSQEFKIQKIIFFGSYTISDQLAQEVRLPYYELIFVQKGCLEITSDNFCGKLEKGSFILLSKDAMRKVTVDNGSAQIINCGFECTSNLIGLIADRPIAISISTQDNLFKAIKESSFIYFNSTKARCSLQSRKQDVFASKQLLRQDLEYFMIMVIRIEFLDKRTHYHSAKKYYKNDLVPMVLKYIDEHIYESISNAQICRVFNVNKTTLSKVFKKAQGTTLIKYINRSKIQIAKNLIRAGEKNFTQIAEELSFSSVHYFCKTFILYESKTPTEYSKTISTFIPTPPHKK